MEFHGETECSIGLRYVSAAAIFCVREAAYFNVFTIVLQPRTSCVMCLHCRLYNRPLSSHLQNRRYSLARTHENAGTLMLQNLRAHFRRAHYSTRAGAFTVFHRLIPRASLPSCSSSLSSHDDYRHPTGPNDWEVRGFCPPSPHALEDAAPRADCTQPLLHLNLHQQFSRCEFFRLRRWKCDHVIIHAATWTSLHGECPRIRPNGMNLSRDTASQFVCRI